MKKISWSNLFKLIHFLSLLIFIGFSISLVSHKILPINYQILLIVMLTVIYLLSGYFIFKKHERHKNKGIVAILLLTMAVGMGLGVFYLNKSVRTLEKINQNQVKEKIDFSIIVRKDSSIKDLSGVFGEKVLVPENIDKENLEIYKKEFIKRYENDFLASQGQDYVSNAKALIEKKADIILLNETYRSLVEDQYPTFSEDTRIVDSLSKLVEKEETEATKEVKKNESFNIYISGIDTFGSIASVSRSDVNLILTVNPQTQSILITTIPRDTYLPIAGAGQGGYDKLTHSGIYGVSSSVETLENFLNTDISYYARVNFSSLVRIVDILGGIEVENPRAFTSTSGAYNFPQGNLNLDGDQALAFSRERYNLAGGDLDRGRNHVKVISGIIRKSLSPAILLNYNSILDVALESVDTNMPYEKIMELINSQVEARSSWNIESQDIKGQGQGGLDSYAMPGWDLYMFVADEESVKGASDAIDSCMGLD